MNFIIRIYFTAQSSSFPESSAGRGELGKLTIKFLGIRRFAMRQYRAALLRKEFSFLDRLFIDWQGNTELWLEQIDKIEIKRGDKALLAKTGREDSYDWSGGRTHDYTKYFAVCLGKEEEDENIIELSCSGYSGTGSGDNQEWEADPICEQLFVKKIVPDYIVECVKNDTDANGNGQVTRFWTIYKMKRFDLGQYHQEQIDKAAAALKAEIAAACKDD